MQGASSDGESSAEMMATETRRSPIPADPVAVPHTLAAETVAAHLDVHPDLGLGSEQARERERKYGLNRLPEAPPRSAWRVFFAQFRSILILVLIGAALLAALIGNVKDAVVILAVVVINAVVGFYQEYRAERSLAALKEMLPVKTHVRRGGEKHEVAAEELVPGDIVLLEAGDRVPADGRLCIAAGLEIDESALTGESQPVGKQTAALPAPDAPLGDRLNMAYMNTMLTRGRAELLVTATGAQTEMGRLSLELAAAVEAPTPLQIQLDRLGKRLGAIALTLVGLLSFLELIRGTDLAHVALDAIALAVAAMPEGLPVVVTVTLLAGLPEPFSPIQILWVAIIMDGPPAVSLALDAARPGVMFDRPRSRTEPVLPFSRLTKIMAHGITMMVGTLAVLYHGLGTGTEQRALTLAFTTFVLFQFFNVFNARTESGTAFNAHFFHNAMLWGSLGGVVALQAVAVHWPPAQAIFGAAGMTPADWGTATAVAACILLFEEGRKLTLALFARRGSAAAPRQRQGESRRRLPI